MFWPKTEVFRKIIVFFSNFGPKNPKNTKIKSRMTLIGKIINGLESLHNLSAGEVIKIEICE